MESSLATEKRRVIEKQKMWPRRNSGARSCINFPINRQDDLVGKKRGRDEEVPLEDHNSGVLVNPESDEGEQESDDHEQTLAASKKAKAHDLRTSTVQVTLS